MTASTTAAWAESYAAVGWRVFPLEPGGKRPLPGFRWQDWATTDATILRDWFTDETRNIGVVTGELFDAFDIEREHLPTFPGWTAAGARRMARTPVADTGRGGWHVLAAPSGRGTTKLLLDGTHIGELKARGGYIVVSPSVTAGQYTWLLAPDGMRPAEAPDWLRDLAAPPPAVRDAQPVQTSAEARRRLETLATTVARTAAGNRNNVLFWAAKRALDEGIPVPAAARALSRAAAHAGCSAREVEATLRSAFG